MKKTLRQLVLVLGALCGVAGFAKEMDKKKQDLCDVVIAKRPDSYVLVSTMQMLDTMKGKKNLIEWSCYADYNPEEDKPLYRTTIWLEGTIKRAPGENVGLSLFDIGAQHRTAIVKLRVLPANPKHRVVTVRINSDGSETELGTETTDTEGFYCIKPNIPYRLKSKETSLRLEAYFPEHPPGSKPKQIEDGGPPSIPPVNEN